MSVNIYWRPRPNQGNEIGTGTPSAFIDSMRQAFGGTERWHLTEANRDTLSGMAAVYKNTSNPYHQLLHALAVYGEIEVWAEW